MNHKQIMADYQAGRLELLGEVKRLIADMGAAEAARKTGLHIVYTSNVKTGQKDDHISYKKLIQMYDDLSKK